MTPRFLFLLILSTAKAVAVGDDWQFSQPLPTSEGIYALAHDDGSQFVAVGDRGTLLSSADGITWERQSSAAAERLSGVVWTGTQFVAVGSGGGIVTSADGAAWTLRVSPVRATWRAVVWDGTRLIATGDAGAIATSTDGVAWGIVRPGVVRDLNSVAASAGTIVTVGEQGAVLTSTNVTTWTQRTAVTTAELRAVAKNTTRWVAVGDGGTVITSDNGNGSTWTTRTSGLTQALRSIGWTGALFVAAGDDGKIITSPDGITWTTQTSGTTRALGAVTFGAGTLVVAGEQGSIVTSTDGVAWTTRSSGPSQGLQDVTHDGGQFIAVGDAGMIRTSVDGLAWITRTSGTAQVLHGISHSTTTRVAVGNAGTLLTSTDGISWTARVSGVSTALRAVVRTDTRFVGVGRSGRVVTSNNGTNWAVQTLGGNLHFLAAAWSGSLVVAVGEGGIIRTSSDGLAPWTARTSGVSTALESVAWNGSIFMAVGADGVVLTSPDGMTWVSRSIPFEGLPDFAELRVVRAVGSSFVVAGSWGLSQPRAFLAESYDGVVWAVRTVGAAPILAGVASQAGSTVAVGEQGATLLNAATNVPAVSVQMLAASVAETVDSTQVVVELSAASTSVVIVPFEFSGSATMGAAGDATVPANQITIPAGETSATITITVIDDLLEESDETVVLTLKTPLGANLGVDVEHTLTILNDDVSPLITADPTGEIVSLGTAVTLTGTATGNAPLSYQWKKGSTIIKGATSTSYTIPSVALSHAGAYQMTATNPVGTTDTSVAELAVVDAAAKTTNLNEGKTATLTVSTAGTNLSYQWFFEERLLSDDTRTSGADKATLVITSLTGADAGRYRCRVTSGTKSMFAGVVTLNVAVKPFVIAPVLSAMRVSEFMEVAVFAGNAPTSYTITGLPSGVTYNKTTGIITGRPLLASALQPYSIKIKATNAAGTSAEVSVPLTVLALADGTSGNYVGTVDRMTLLNANSYLGGSVSLAVASTGKVTGSLKLGTSTYSFLPALDTAISGDPSCVATIPRKGMTSLVVSFDLNPTTGEVTGSISDGSTTAPLRAWRAMAAPFAGFTGYHTCAFKLATPGDDGDVAVPQGYGYATFTVGSTGTATGTIRLADGVNATLSTALRNNGALVVYLPLYANTGSLLGTLNLAGGLVSSAGLDWWKAPQALNSTTRSYKGGFGPVSLLVTGALYSAPAGIIMDLGPSNDDVPNADLTFEQGGAPDPVNRLNVELRYSAPNVRDPQTPNPNPGLVTITTTTGTGLFSGGFTLTDTDYSNVEQKRVTSFDGVIARDVDAVLRGFSRFQLAKMPDNLVSPVTTLKTSPQLSGRVLLSPKP